MDLCTGNIFHNTPNTTHTPTNPNIPPKTPNLPSQQYYNLSALSPHTNQPQLIPTTPPQHYFQVRLTNISKTTDSRNKREEKNKSKPLILYHTLHFDSPPFFSSSFSFFYVLFSLSSVTHSCPSLPRLLHCSFLHFPLLPRGRDQGKGWMGGILGAKLTLLLPLLRLFVTLGPVCYVVD